jgi:hypothetical protein
MPPAIRNNDGTFQLLFSAGVEELRQGRRPCERAVSRPIVRPPRGGNHTVRRHGGRGQDVVVLEVDVPRSWLRKSRRGLWYCVKDIPPVRIVGVVDFHDLSESPVMA